MAEVTITAETGGEQGASAGASATILRRPRGWVAVAWSLFQMYTAAFGQFDLYLQLPAHVTFALVLCFLQEGGPDRLRGAGWMPRRPAWPSPRGATSSGSPGASPAA